MIQVCRVSDRYKKPYLTYNILVESFKLNIPKLSKKQLSLYDKICQFRDEGLTYKQISDKLNKLGISPTRGKVGEFTPQKVWSNYSKIKKNLDRKDIYYPPDIEDVNLEWK
tara:strand:+ start:159 stop:491 length:333 start_codon:yes stop_codon:yes gene_type:complete